MVHIEKRFYPLWLFLLFSPFLAGGFYEWVSCLFSFFLTGYLFYCGRKTGRLFIHKNFTLLMTAILVLCYGASGIWAVDHGMAIFGFFKFLPFPLFILAVMQLESTERQKLMETVPLSGAAMVVLSVLLGQISALHEFFYVNRRLAGFFQYPNTFALYLLAGAIILIGKEQWNIWRALCFAILLPGMILTGSRTSFVILIVVVIWFCIILKEKKNKWALFMLSIGLVTVTAVYAVSIGNVSTMARYLTIPFRSSTFLGRLLYFKDALPIIARHPFGLGYMGYYYIQGEFQTGVYSVLNIHNELLQILLDIGWMPAILFVLSVIKSFISKKKAPVEQILIFTIFTHSMFDFDLQFISIGFVLLLAMDTESKAIWLCRNAWMIRLTECALTALCVWFGIVSGLYRFGRYEAAVKLYPGCTDAWVSILPQAEDVEEMEHIADKIIFWNQSVSLAYSAKARAAYTEGNFEDMITYKQRAILLSKYELEEYLDYFDMLYTGIQLYMEYGDLNSAEYCRERLLEIPDMLETVLEETDELAWKINDRPELVLPDQYQDILNAVGSEADSKENR